MKSKIDVHSHVNLCIFANAQSSLAPGSVSANGRETQRPGAGGSSKTASEI